MVPFAPTTDNQAHNSFGKKKGIPDDSTAKEDVIDITGEANDAEPDDLVDEAAIAKMVRDAETIPRTKEKKLKTVWSHSEVTNLMGSGSQAYADHALPVHEDVLDAGLLPSVLVGIQQDQQDVTVVHV